MQIRTRLCMSADGYVTTPDGWPVQLADPAFVPGESYDFPEFQKTCDAVLMGRTTFEPALGADTRPAAARRRGDAADAVAQHRRRPHSRE